MSQGSKELISDWANKILLSVCGVLLFSILQDIKEIKINQIKVLITTGEQNIKIENIEDRLDVLEDWKKELEKYQRNNK